jgi:hypothetical protein
MLWRRRRDATINRVNPLPIIIQVEGSGTNGSVAAAGAVVLIAKSLTFLSTEPPAV